MLVNAKINVIGPLIGRSRRRWRSSVFFLALAATGTSFSARTQTPAFRPGTALGQVTDSRVIEASGLAASRQNPGVLWTHNDAGSEPRLFALSTNGALLGSFLLAPAGPSDFEDIAIGPGPGPGIEYVYLGDIGDNDRTRENVRVYRLPEPPIYDRFATNPPSQPAPEATEIALAYPDGPHDAEALWVDPITGDLFIATKQAGVSQIYRAPKVQIESASTVLLELVRRVDFELVSAGDISSDGREIILRREDAARLWVRAPGESIADALANSPVNVPVIGPPIEPNGEAVAFHPAGLGYYTLSEGKGQSIYFFPRLSVEIPLRFTRPPWPQGQAWRLEFSGPPGSRVNLDCASNPAATLWHPLGTVVLTNGNGSFLHSPPVGTAQFYRLRR